MDVTNSNFQILLPEIRDAINSASFICLDGEFTGLSSGDNVPSFATPAEYYGKVRNGALDFLFVQFGLSVFVKEDFGKKYTNKTYTFYLFPRPLNRHAPDKRFLCQASSLTFLAEHGFDFNKLFKEGISYLTQSDEDTLRESLAERQKLRESLSSTPNSTKVPVPSKFQSIVDEAVKSIKDLLDPECKKEEVKIEKCSGFVRKLIYQTLDEEIKSLNISLVTQNGVLVATRGLTKEQVEQKKKEKLLQEEQEIEDAVGFSKVIRELSQSGKLIVGHNMLMDICHIVNAFLDPLPQEYKKFKEMVHCLFPNLIDTKFMCSEKPLKELIPSSVLEHLLNTLQKSPFELPEIINENEECTINLKKVSRLHDAGYDAFITGLCFLSALHHIESDVAGVEQPVNSPKLKKYLNKLFLMRTPDTYMNLQGIDPKPSREHVFHLTFPKNWTSQEICELFSPYGGVQIWWQSNTTAWAGLHDKSEAKRVSASMENKQSKLPPGVAILSYERYTSKTGTAAFSPRPNKRKSKVNDEDDDDDDKDKIMDDTKKRKSSTNEFIIDTIAEEEENSKDIEVIEDIPSGKNSSTFPMNHDWN